jgi:hypothetical protein
MSAVLEAVKSWGPVVTPVLVAFTGVGVSWVNRKISSMTNRQTYMYIKQEAMDKALESTFKNGYAQARDMELTKLIKKHEFIESKMGG